MPVEIRTLAQGLWLARHRYLNYSIEEYLVQAQASQPVAFTLLDLPLGI